MLELGNKPQCFVESSLIINGSQAPKPSRAYVESNVIPFPTGRKEDVGYRSTGFAGRTSLKDALGRELPAYMHDKHIAVSFLAYRTNPMAHRIIEMEVNFVLGNGITLTCFDSPETLAVIGGWWNDPYNNWPVRMAPRLRDLYLYGEWLHRPLIHPESGFMFVRDTQPDNIDHLLPDPFDHSQVDRIVLKQKDMSTSIQPNLWGANIRERLNETTGELSPPSGDFFHIGINRTTDSLRGVGELFPLLDYIDMYDSILFSRAEKIENMSHVYYDLLLDGMSEAEMRNYLVQETNVPPRPGSVWAHNAQATLTTVTADLKADDHATDVGVLKSHIISSAGWPETWFGENGGGRASAAEMSEGALKNITQLQAFVAQALRLEIDYMLYQQIHLGKLKVGDSSKSNRLGIPQYAISFSRPTAKDIQRMGPSLARYAEFVNTVTSKVPLLTQEEGRQLIVAQIQQLGLTDAPMSIELPTDLPKIPAPKDPNTIVPGAFGGGGPGGSADMKTKQANMSPAMSKKAASTLAADAQLEAGTHISQLYEKLY